MKINKTSKFLIIFFIGFTLILTISFLWGEKIYFNSIYKINDTKFGNYFTSIGAIGTMVSLVFLFLQLKEMEKQRNESIKPDLYPLLTSFSMEEIIDENGNVHIFPKEIDFITIKNIGLGAAKSISLKWNYDLNEIEKIILKKYYNQKPEVLENEQHDIIVKEGEIKIKPP